MSETGKTYAELQALLADNTSSNISPEDLRDLMRSVMGGYGAIRIDAAAAPQALLAGVPQALAGWDASFNTGLDVTAAHATGDLTCDIAGDYRFDTVVGYELAGAGTLDFHFYVDGVEVGPHVPRLTTANNVPGTLSLHHFRTLTAGQAVTLWVEAVGSGETITVAGAELMVQRLS